MSGVGEGTALVNRARTVLIFFSGYSGVRESLVLGLVPCSRARKKVIIIFIYFFIYIRRPPFFIRGCIFIGQQGTEGGKKNNKKGTVAHTFFLIF